LPLDILIILVVIGIGGVVLLTWALGWARPTRLVSTEEVKNQFRLDHPELEIGKVMLSTDGLAGLLELSDNAIGLIFSFGDKFVTRRLTPQIVKSIEVDDQAQGTQVLMRLADFTTPKIHMSFSDRDVKSLLNSLTNSEAGQ
jgi:hypothetical protein